jgi:rhizosphere induced protein
MKMSKYTLTVENQSTQTGDFCIFQEMPDINVPNIVTLAWLSKTAHPTTTLTFDWTVDYSFFWSTQKDLQAGAHVSVVQTWPCNLDTYNQVTLDRSCNAYTFTSQEQGAYPGNLYIQQTGNIQSNGASVGVAMSGKGAFAVQSQPNMKIIMTPKPTYYVVFGSFEEGTVIDIGEITETAYPVQFKGTQSKELVFTAENVFKSA